ncbi:MAG: putative Fe-S cluster protein YjdI [Flavobacteriaceae bacterium]|jgi:uncharacterized Fe-S cluster protein YjdI
MSTEYTDGTTTVIWDKTKCIHAAKCAQGLPSVFNPKEKRWINVEGANAEEVIAQVHQCPSGAISMKE